MAIGFGPMDEDGEYWDGDDEGEELPILDDGGEPLAPAEASTAHRRRRMPAPPAPRSGVPLAAAADARRAVLAAATGTARQEPAQWREEMASGQRDRAASSIEAGGRRNSGGFGLA